MTSGHLLEGLTLTLAIEKVIAESVHAKVCNVGMSSRLAISCSNLESSRAATSSRRAIVIVLSGATLHLEVMRTVDTVKS